MIGQSAGKTYAYILGVYLGDGCVTTSGYTSIVFRLNTIDKDFAEATAQALQELTGKKPNYREHAVKKGSNNFALSHSCRDLCYDLVVDTDRKHKIPSYVHTWDKQLKIAFIAGLMDSEGFVAENSNPTNRRYYMGYKSCDVWFDDFVRILQSVGVKIGKIGIEKPRKEGYKIPKRFTIKMQSWIDSGCYFNIRRKQDRVDMWKSSGAYTQRAKFPKKVSSETNMLDT